MQKIKELIRTKRFPYVTIGLIILNLVYFAILVFNGNPNSTAYMLSMGADCAPYVFNGREFWRLLTSMFMHFSFQHLAGNMIYLGIIGFSYERMIGSLKFFLIYLLSGIGGNVVSCAYNQLTGQAVVSAGASGAVYGIIAIVVYLSYVARKRTGNPRMFLRIAIMLVFMFYSNFASGKGIDIAAHIGGLVFGVFLCLVLLPVKGNNAGKK